MQGHGEARVTLDQPPAIGDPAVGGVLTKSAASCRFVWVNRPPGGESRTPYWGKLLCSVCKGDYSSKGNQGLPHRQDSRRHCLEHQLLRYELSGQEGGDPELMEEGLHIPSKWKAVNTCFGGSRCAGTLSWSRASHPGDSSGAAGKGSPHPWSGFVPPMPTEPGSHASSHPSGKALCRAGCWLNTEFCGLQPFRKMLSHPIRVILTLSPPPPSPDAAILDPPAQLGQFSPLSPQQAGFVGPSPPGRQVPQPHENMAQRSLSILITELCVFFIIMFSQLFTGHVVVISKLLLNDSGIKTSQAQPRKATLFHNCWVAIVGSAF